MSEDLLSQFSEIHKDVFLEIANLGIGKAAATMSSLVDRHVNIAVPELVFIDVSKGVPPAFLKDQITVQVRQRFYGGIDGEAILALSRTGAILLSRLLLDDADMDDAFGDNEQGAILETGNIMIGGLVGKLANTLGVSLKYDIPQIKLKGESLFTKQEACNVTCAVIIKAKLTIDDEDITSYLILRFCAEHFKQMMLKLDDLY
jgi:chemotaxis protein CheC